MAMHIKLVLEMISNTETHGEYSPTASFTREAFRALTNLL